LHRRTRNIGQLAMHRVQVGERMSEPDDVRHPFPRTTLHAVSMSFTVGFAEAAQPEKSSASSPTGGLRRKDGTMTLTATATVRRTGGWLAEHSVTSLRVSLGLIILGFGVLKYFPGVSPAEGLAERTVNALTFGVLHGTAAVVATAIVETVLGLILLTGKGLRVGLVLMAGWLLGIMAPVVLFFGDLFPGFVPTLEAQYVLKDVILAAAGAVVAAHALGARYTIDADR
jgi:hypothetical protein